MFCPKCGTQVPDGSPFCSSCGAPLGQQQAPANQGGMNFTNQPKNFGGSNANLDPKAMVNDFTKNIKDIPNLGIPSFVMLGGALLFFISLLLPYYSVLGISVNLFDGGALHWLLALIIFACTVFIAVTKQGLPMLIQGGIAVVYAIFEWIFQSPDKSVSVYVKAVSKHGAGFYLMLIAAVAICVGGVLKFLEEKKN
ncbi:MAG: zinc ribbon domain-containing protein [Ruminococcus sp.]|nr:zinc ribbon domain-containing protein [Ruminococcus sp.]